MTSFARTYFDSRLFDYLASLPSAREWAWDCGTGRGEVALALTEHFSAVRATDINPALVNRAIRHARIFYSTEAAGKSAIGSGAMDMATVAQTLHWLDLDSFYAEARRVLKKGGVIAAWCYGRCEIMPRIDRQLERYCRAVDPYWPAAFQSVAKGYRDLPFPFREISTPMFWVSAAWSFRDLSVYFGNWSATRKLMAAEPREHSRLLARVQKAWGDSGDRRPIRWPIHLRVGTNTQ